MWRREGLLRNDISGKRVTSMFRVERLSELVTNMKMAFFVVTAVKTSNLTYLTGYVKLNKYILFRAEH
jgi:SpoU rRNA methylase family enzyme